jgi:hypothetical protein
MKSIYARRFPRLFPFALGYFPCISVGLTMLSKGEWRDIGI